MRGWQRWLVASSISAALATGGAFGQAPVAKSALDSGSVARVVEALAGLVEHEVRASDGDLGSQHVHWVFTFSTGHFALDPIRAQAARETALGMLEQMAVQATSSRRTRSRWMSGRTLAPRRTRPSSRTRRNPRGTWRRRCCL